MSELKTMTMTFEGKLSKEAIKNFVTVLNELYDKGKSKELESTKN
ncbi:hypothetical protein BAOM_2929 [Peribacillus asahii]|uniref:Uncharacterized protein n=1 Tax=Peribacillus asahii TaxID=228899 RepID=A0A3T0KT87_9BACI|nr:hypothetical protein [Peribacillus asahii]AZV43538.1 hypothetical protein BAOM_2929 [Peribacillus asahii]